MSLTTEQILKLETQAKSLGFTYKIEKDGKFFTSRIFKDEKPLVINEGQATAWESLDSVMTSFQRIVGASRHLVKSNASE